LWDFIKLRHSNSEHMPQTFIELLLRALRDFFLAQGTFGKRGGARSELTSFHGNC